MRSEKLFLFNYFICGFTRNIEMYFPSLNFNFYIDIINLCKLQIVCAILHA